MHYNKWNIENKQERNEMTKNSIALIGFIATGKTSVGEALVNQLGDG